VNSNGNPAEVDANVHVVGGALESSNVNVIDAMVSMISLARQFETQMKLMQSAENNANKASQLLSLG
jgi:flagellar basal-body rod protein FlgF